jgi:hypothetical protein
MRRDSHQWILIETIVLIMLGHIAGTGRRASFVLRWENDAFDRLPPRGEVQRILRDAASLTWTLDFSLQLQILDSLLDSLPQI